MMAPLIIPESGVTLLEIGSSTTDDDTSKLETKPIQAMQLELTDDVVQEILRSARHSGKGMNMSFGKTIVSSVTTLLTSVSAIDTISIDSSLWEQVTSSRCKHLPFAYPTLRLHFKQRERARHRWTSKP